MTKILEDYSLVNNIKNNNNNGRKSPRCDEIDIRSPLASRRRFVSSPKTLSPLSIRKSSLPESFEEHVAPDALYIGGGELLSARLSPVVGLKRRVDNLPGCDSRRSSGSSSIPEVIEECDSDEELNDDFVDGDSIANDYIRCINCSRSKSTDSIDKLKTGSTPSLINYCHKCRHLNHNPHLPAFYEGRRSSWTAGVNYLNSPRNSRKSSLASSASELPIISEPSFDEETNDTIELQISVKQEVDKLLKLNNSKNILTTKNSTPLLKTTPSSKQNGNEKASTTITTDNKSIPATRDINHNRKQKLISLRETKI